MWVALSDGKSGSEILVNSDHVERLEAMKTETRIHFASGAVTTVVEPFSLVSQWMMKEPQT